MRWIRHWQTCALASLLIPAMLAAAETTGVEPDRDPDSRWIPSIALFTGGLVQERSASVESLERGESGRAEVATLWSVGASAALTTPVVWDGPGRPRLFVHGDIGAVLNQEEPVAGEGDPGKLPRVLEDPITGRRPILGVANLGSATRVQTEPLLLAAGAGIAFETQVLGRSLHIKPSFEWLWQEDRMRALLGHVETVDEATNPLLCELPGPAPDEPLPGCRLLFIDSTDTQSFHSIGPGLEIEVDAARSNDWLFSLYLFARTYRVIGDREMELSGRGAWKREDGAPTSRADSVVDARYERDAWHYNFGVGIRLHWFPE